MECSSSSGWLSAKEKLQVSRDEAKPRGKLAISSHGSITSLFCFGTGGDSASAVRMRLKTFHRNWPLTHAAGLRLLDDHCPLGYQTLLDSGDQWSFIWNLGASRTVVPEISRFLGIVIAMYYNDHAPPHFHARYGEFEIRVNIESGIVMSGEFPRRARKHVLEWLDLHRDELMEDWILATERRPLFRIEPLE